MMNKVCEELKGKGLEGNIVPISWYSHIKTLNNTIDHVAITLLADIFFWYRPSEVRDESTGQLIGYKQKFTADKLQKSYQEYSNLFGYSKTQVKRAIDNLIRLKLITREFRNIHTKTGLAINNVMYIEPVLDTIFTLTYRVTLHESKVTPPENVSTNTESSSKITPKIKKKTPEPEHTGTDCSSSDIVDQSVSQNNNKTTNKENSESHALIIDLFYKDYEKLYGEKLELNPKEIGCIKNLLKKDKDSFQKKYNLLLTECKKEKNTFFKLTPSILLYSWNQLVEIKKETWEERMERIKKGDLHYE